MMKSILLSIKPKYVELIARGEKTIEVRKTAPQEVPFKAYIYCTKEKKQDDIIWAGVCGDRGKWNEHIIGEFVCDRVDEYNFHNGLTEFNSMGLPLRIYGSYLILADYYKSMCLSYDEVKNYGKGKTIYGWHISDLKIYDRPKELSEFNKTKERIARTCGMQARNGLCCAIDHEELCDNIKCCFKTPCPPQSWIYVEDLGEEE